MKHVTHKVSLRQNVLHLYQAAKELIDGRLVKDIVLEGVGPHQFSEGSYGYNLCIYPADLIDPANIVNYLAYIEKLLDDRVKELGREYLKSRYPKYQVSVDLSPGHSFGEGANPLEVLDSGNVLSVTVVHCKGNDFWKADFDETDMSCRLKALGISHNFLYGEEAPNFDPVAWATSHNNEDK